MGEAARKEDETLVPVGPGAEDLPEHGEHDRPEADGSGDERDQSGDERLGSRDEETEPDARHRETAKERRERQKRARARERAELEFYRSRNVELEKRVAQIDQRTAQNETAHVEQRITTLQTQIATAERVLAEAVKKQNGDDAAEALRIRDTLRDELAQLSHAKQALTQRARATESAPSAAPATQPAPDPKMIAMARRWADSHPWFELDGSDEDSVIVRAIDESLAAEGYDPSTQEYWDELSSRVKRRLPERFNEQTDGEDEGDEPTSRRANTRAPSGPRFSSGGRERPLRKNEVYISKDRKEALMQAGLWEDPVARNRMLRRYADIDAEIAASGRS